MIQFDGCAYFSDGWAKKNTNLSPSNRQDFDKQIRQSAFSCNDEVGTSSAKPLEMMLLGLVGWLVEADRFFQICKREFSEKHG